MTIALSWSRLQTYEQCPTKFRLQFITKSFPQEEASIHLVKGSELHKQLENYVIAKNGGGEMPIGFSPEVKGTLPYVDKLYTLYDAIYPEAQIACTVDWKPTEWFGRDVGWRGVWDVVGMKPRTLFIGDYKSGRIYPYGAGFGQLHLSAVMGLNRFPEVPEVNAAYIYLEHQKITPIKMTRADLPAAQESFDSRFQKVQMERNWDPTPNENCKWCPATKMQCKFSRKL